MIPVISACMAGLMECAATTARRFPTPPSWLQPVPDHGQLPYALTIGYLHHFPDATGTSATWRHMNMVITNTVSAYMHVADVVAYRIGYLHHFLRRCGIHQVRNSGTDCRCGSALPVPEHDEEETGSHEHGGQRRSVRISHCEISRLPKKTFCKPGLPRELRFFAGRNRWTYLLKQNILYM